MHVGVFLGEFKPDVGGGYTFVNDVAEAFFATAAESPHRFTVFCPKDAVTQLQQRGLPANVRPVALAPRNMVGKGINALKHASPLFTLLWRRSSALERAAQREKIDMLWFVGGFFDTPDMPFITTVWDVQHLTHPWFPEVSAKGKWDYRERFLKRHLRRASRIITGTEVGRQELIDFYGLPEGRINILPHPTPAFALAAKPLDKQTILQKFNLRDGFLFYPAQFWAHKNHVNLIHALAKLKERGADVPDLALVGSDKGNKAHVMQVAAELGVADKVKSLGFVSVEELTGLYAAAATLAYASFSGPENLPPLEAFALRCPVLNSEFPGAREQLGDAARYFNPHDPDDIADTIQAFLGNEKERALRVEKGAKRAQGWTGRDFVHGVFKLLDGFAPERRCWPS